MNPALLEKVNQLITSIRGHLTVIHEYRKEPCLTEREARECLDDLELLASELKRNL